MKRGARYIAIVSGPIAKTKKTLLVGVIFRNDYIEGLLSSKISVDGTDSTDQIIKMICASRFMDQIKVLLFNGIALAGLNIIDTKALEDRLGAKIVLLNKRRQNANELINALKEFSKTNKVDVTKRIDLVDRSRSLVSLKVDILFLQSSLDKAYLRYFAERAFESLRIAHIVASGISKGESKGRL